MRRMSRLAPGLAAVLIAVAVAGCAGAGEASNARQAATPVKVLDATPTPGGPAGDRNVAGTPMAPGAVVTPAGSATGPQGSDEEAAALDPAGWDQHRFHDDWEFAFPAGWQVDRPGEGNVILSGELAGASFLVDIARVFEPSAITPEEWVNRDLTRVQGENQSNLSVVDVEVAGEPAKRTSGLLLADVPGVHAEKYDLSVQCPAERIYVWDKGDGDSGLLIITVVQTGDAECNPELLTRLTDTLLDEVTG